MTKFASSNFWMVAIARDLDDDDRGWWRRVIKTLLVAVLLQRNLGQRCCGL
jgi:hypothetical protein